MDVIEKQGHRTESFQTGFGLSFTAALIGGRDWSLRNLYGANPDRELALELGQALKPLGAEQVYAPTPGFNAEFVEREQLTDFVHLTRYPDMDSMRIWRNKSLLADCASLHHPGAAGVFSGGGCPMMVATHGRHMLFAHAGRGSVLPAHVEGVDQKGRRHESVANTAFAAFERMEPGSFNAADMQVWMFWSIRPEHLRHDFDNPLHREKSSRIAKYVQRYGTEAGYEDGNAFYLDLPGVLRQQFLTLGVSHRNIHVDEEYSYLPDSMPTTRSEDPVERNKRYLVAAIRSR